MSKSAPGPRELALRAMREAKYARNEHAPPVKVAKTPRQKQGKKAGR